MGETPLWHRVGRRALELGERAAQELLTEQQRNDLIERALRGVQGSRRLIDDGSQRLLERLGLASQADLHGLERRLGRLRKRVEALTEQLEEG